MKQQTFSFAGRASNPTKASPTQLAARKRFAEMARSGAFKKATKRKANPETIQYIVFSELSPQKYKQMIVTENKQRAISMANVNQMDGYHSVVEDQVGHLIYDAKTRQGYLQSNPSKRKTNPAKKTVSQKISQLVHEGYPQRQSIAVALSEQRAGKVKRNPSGLYAMKTQYLVSCPVTKKNMGFFDKQSDAKIYAQELADKHDMQYAISTVKVPKIQAVHFVVGESTKSFKV